jgi:hypothetical protein
LAEKPEGKKALGRPRHRWKDIVKMDLGEIGLEGVDCIHLAQDRDIVKMDLGEIGLESVDWIHLAQDTDWCQAFVNTVVNLQALGKEGNFLTS